MPMYSASSFASGCWLPTNGSRIPSSLMYRSSLCESHLGQMIGVHASLLNCHLWAKFSFPFMTSAVFFYIYCSALRTSLARVQGLSLMVATHNSTSLKENAITEDIFIYFSLAKKNFVSGHEIQKSPSNNACRFLYVFPWQYLACALYIALFNQFGSNNLLHESVPSPPNASL